MCLDLGFTHTTHCAAGTGACLPLLNTVTLNDWFPAMLCQTIKKVLHWKQKASAAWSVSHVSRGASAPFKHQLKASFGKAFSIHVRRGLHTTGLLVSKQFVIFRVSATLISVSQWGSCTTQKNALSKLWFLSRDSNAGKHFSFPSFFFSLFAADITRAHQRDLLSPYAV